MKELSIEEKAKCYDEAIERAKEMIKAMTNIGGVAKVDDIQYLFPELKESKGEKIRKVIYGWIYTQPSQFFDSGFSKEEMLAWLEKQGEQKPYGQREECFDCQFNYAGECKGSCAMKRGEQKPADTEKGANGNEREIPNSAWSEEDEAGLGDALWAVQQARTLAKDENDMGNLWYAEKWLNSLKGRLQPNQYWSKEDEKIYQSILDDTVQENQLDDKQILWLKSLKDRVQPKQEWSEDDYIPKFHIGDKLVSTKNPSLTYDVLEVGHISELGNPEYKVEIFTDGKVENPHNIHYMECYKVDEWAKLIEQKPAGKYNIRGIKSKHAEGKLGEMIKEMEATDKVEPKFHEGDWIVENTYASTWLITGVFTTEGNVTSYNMINQEGRTLTIGSHNINYRYHLWSIQDARDGDVLAAHECIVLFKEIDGLNIKCHCTYHFMNNPSFYVNTLQNKSAFHPATKEQRDLLFQKIKEDGYEWNTEELKLKTIEQKYNVSDNDSEKRFVQSDDRDKELSLSLQIQAYLNTASDELYASGKPLCSEKHIKDIHKCMLMWKKLHDSYFHNIYTWSEEDETTLNSILSCIKHCQDEDTEAQCNGNRYVDPKHYESISDWLKSLKDRVQSKQE